MKKNIIFLLIIFLVASFFIDSAPAGAADGKVPVYSFWSKNYNYHFYTSLESERSSLAKRTDFEYEDIAWYDYSSQDKTAVPVYRFRNNAYSYYFYTTSLSKKNALLKESGWTYKSVGFYAYAAEKENTVPVYKIYNAAKKVYIFTSSPGEKKCLISGYPAGQIEDRGIAFWVPKVGANVSADEVSCHVPYGPEISVGLWSYTRDNLKDGYFRIEANKDYRIKDKNGNIIAKIPAETTTKVKYAGDQKFKIYSSISDKIVAGDIYFEAKDGNNTNLIMNAHRPDSSYDQYRGKIRLKYNDTSKLIWVINILPMEQYAWGNGETTGTGPYEHTKVMTTIFRTYGYWYLKYATKYLPYGFRIKSDSGNQIYRGYEWEVKYPNIKKAATATKGRIVKYGSEIALTPYSSWSDGRTRSFEERWGSDDYPWCRSVKDPYGKHPTMSTKELEAAGNHMVGLVGNGSVKLAGSSYKKTYDWIIKYYYTGITLTKMY
jgi:hypothetical protein